MLKLLSSSSSSCLHGRLHSLHPGPTELASPVLRVLGSLAGLTRPSPNSARRAFFCSDGSDGSDQVVEIEFKGAGAEAEAESKSSSAIVSTNPRPEDYLTVGWLWNLVLLSGLFGFQKNIRKCLGFFLCINCVMVSSIAIVLTCLFFGYCYMGQVLALPLPHRPLFPGFYMPIYVKVHEILE